ncbi:MAG: virulence protein RhuM/Fic/DOC family protein [Planctomycetota bacterium]
MAKRAVITSGKGEIILYCAPDGRATLDVRFEEDTLWLTQKQIAELFATERSVVTKHLRNIFNSRELDEKRNVQKMHIAGSDKPVTFHNLDVILSVGYRVNSKRGTQFRIWATSVLREHLMRGLTINRQRLEENAQEIETALELVRRTIASSQLTTDMGRGLVEVIARYTHTFLWLQRYDQGLLIEPKGEKGGDLPSTEEARAAIGCLKANLVARKEAGDLFGQELAEGLAAILGNLQQSAFGQPAYPSIESKAAHLLYFVIKSHPFSDGNKRIAAMLFSFCFVIDQNANISMPMITLNRSKVIQNTAKRVKIWQI